MSFTAGDIFYKKENGKFNIYKLLVNDADFGCYHVLMYTPVASLPAEDSIHTLDIYLYHAPINSSSFDGSTLLTNRPVVADDLIGYHEFLRQTQDPGYYVKIAGEYYQEGYRLTDEHKHLEAIDAYSKAIDLFPSFYEAIDNRAFCKMDLGLWEEAIEDFKLSLEENPNSFLAEFSIGECYFKMGDLEKAKGQFEIAKQINPEEKATDLFLEAINKQSG
ncbi:MAG: tetratricopeptide repeat protein, partial [Chitinophagaceae bacterium]|nr:tetratricopeptide repeat protein [Chitinophagaceae bacterium]